MKEKNGDRPVEAIDGSPPQGEPLLKVSRWLQLKPGEKVTGVWRGFIRQYSKKYGEQMRGVLAIETTLWGLPAHDVLNNQLLTLPDGEQCVLEVQCLEHVHPSDGGNSYYDYAVYKLT